MPKALQIPLKPSRIWASFLLLLHLISASCIFYAGLSLTLTVLLIVALVLHLVYHYKLWAFAPVRVVQYHDDGFSLVLASQVDPILVELSSASRVNRFCSVLRFKPQVESGLSRQYTVIICADSADPQLLRQLWVLLFTGQYSKEF